MTLKLAEIINLYTHLVGIIDDAQSVDVALKFKLLGILKQIEVPVGNFEKIRNERIKEYGTKDKSGDISINVKDIDSVQKFNEDMSTVLDEDVEINITLLRPEDVLNKGIGAQYLIGLYSIIQK